MRLHVVVEEDEAGYFAAEVPALPGCLSEGKTREEAIANVKEAIEGWLEVMEAKQAIDTERTIEVIVGWQNASGCLPEQKWRGSFSEQVGRLPGSLVPTIVKTGFEYTLSIPQHNELSSGLPRKLTRQLISPSKNSTVSNPRHA
jgi:predicted RNase H-like HicB family nuclease